MGFKRRVQAYLTGSTKTHFEAQKKKFRTDLDSDTLRAIIKEHQELTSKDIKDTIR